MRDPYYDSWPRGQGIRAQIVYCIDMIARLVVGLMVMWLLLFVLLYAFGDVSPWPKH
jgi:tetrahydromethanopterin S-methyltransferase subunit B